MTEEAKQTVLLLFRDILRHGEPEAEMRHFETIYATLLHSLSHQIASDLRTHLLLIATQIKAAIQETRAKYQRTQRIIAHIEQTPAAELSHESILAIG